MRGVNVHNTGHEKQKTKDKRTGGAEEVDMQNGILLSISVSQKKMS